MSYLIIQWPDGDRRIIDYVASERDAPSYQILEQYRNIFGEAVEWVGCDQKDWLRKYGFIT